jgi:hypothetical protein
MNVKFHKERLNHKRLNEADVTEQYHDVTSNRLAIMENLGTEGGINRIWETIGGNIKISAKESISYYGMKKHKS